MIRVETIQEEHANRINVFLDDNLVATAALKGIACKDIEETVVFALNNMVRQLKRNF